jgi:hypothetical protein
METNPKSSTLAKSSGLMPTLTGWVRQGMESFVASQKILLDLAAQQNSLALGFVRERVNFSPLRPLTGMVELTGRGIANIVAAQKILLDLAADENALFFWGVKDGLRLSGTAAAMTDAVTDGVKAFVRMQKRFLDLVDEQSQAAVEAIKEGKPYEGKSLAEVTRQGLENFIDTQKKFLDLVTEVARPQAPAKGRKGIAPTARRKVTDLAKEGVETFVDSQKKLLKLASRQIDEMFETAREIVRPSPEPSTTVGEFIRRGAENFINAQRSLLDVAMKPFLPPPHAPIAAATAARRVRHA